MSTNQTVTSRDGTKIAFDRSGDGAAVVFVGPTLADRTAGGPLTAQLAKHFTAFNYDRRGRGESSDTQPYAIEREVDDLAAMIEEAGGSAFVIGGSSGAVLALDAAARGLAITKLALYEPPFKVDDSAPPAPGGYLEQLTKLLAADRRGDAVQYYMTAMMGVPAERLGGMRKGPFWHAWEALAHTLVYDATILEGTQAGNPLPPGRWAGVTVPTLVMDGGDSPQFMHSAAQALADLLPAVVEHRTLPGQTHAVDVEVLAGVLTEYFTD